MRNVDRLPTAQLLQAVRQVFAPWHRRTVDEDWNDADSPLECRLDLDPYEIIKIVEAPSVVCVGAGIPILPDDRDEHVAYTELLGEYVEEIQAGLDIVDI
jgi:hypothetical protein